MSTSLAVTPKKEALDRVKEGLEKFRSQLKIFLRDDQIISEEITSVLDIVAANPDLQKCSPASIVRSAYHAASLKVSVNPKLGLAHIIPRWNSKTRCMEASFQPGFRFYINKVIETGFVENLRAEAVYSNEHFAMKGGSRPELIHDQIFDNEKGGLRLVYAVADLPRGRWMAKVMSVAEVEEHRRKFSQSPDSPAWKQHFEKMALKTVIMALCRKLPIGTTALRELNSAIDSFEEDQPLALPPVANDPVAPTVPPVVPPFDPATGEVNEEPNENETGPVIDAEAEPVTAPAPEPPAKSEQQVLLGKYRDLIARRQELDIQAPGEAPNAEHLPCSKLRELNEMLAADIKIAEKKLAGKK